MKRMLVPGFRRSTRGDQLKILTESVVHSHHGCTSAGPDGATDGETGDTGSVSDIMFKEEEEEEEHPP